MGNREDQQLTRRVTREYKQTQPSCYLCGMPINYDAKFPHPDSLVVDHLNSYTRHPELRNEPANLKPAHRACNSNKYDKPAAVSIGHVSEKW